MPTTKRHVQQAITYANSAATALFYPLYIYTRAMRRGDEKLDRDFHRERRDARFADRRRSTALDASFH